MNYSSVSGKIWSFRKFDNSDLIKFSEIYSLKEITARLLAIRKKSIGDINLFLKPTIKNLLPNPLKLKDMDKLSQWDYIDKYWKYLPPRKKCASPQNIMY